MLFVALASSRSKNLPELLTKAELVQKLSDKQWTPKDNADDVVNPPPTPETDGQETMEEAIHTTSGTSNASKVDKYENDYLDLSAGNDMDMF